ncbi:MAG: hypothetical protein HY482_00755 [Candidatus Wildermuthbacteria bacterium]|nr:hypothetical protein [Candidatus Wildermuthbacteria bacterium]
MDNFITKTVYHTSQNQLRTGGRFVDGRGPLEFRQGNLLYLNHPEKSGLNDFQGEEEILENNIRVGSHWYKGRLLIPATSRN